MTRGRRPMPDEIKELRGNPGKRPLTTLAPTKNPDVAAAIKPEPRAALVIPEYLTLDSEKEIFRKIVEDLQQRRIARSSDLQAYARYAAYLNRWIDCKNALTGRVSFFKSESKHGELLRRHPLMKDMIDLERLLQALEDRLGLNPVARQNIVRGLANMPAPIGGLFGDEAAAQPAPSTDGEEVPVDAPSVHDIAAPAPSSALGFLAPRPPKLN